MPLGIIPIGFTKYGKIEPQCYNCEMGSRDNRCCGRQANAIANKMVNFKTPDYVFPNDSNIRKQYREDLQKIGLHANPSL
jgi:hypothetical protein